MLNGEMEANARRRKIFHRPMWDYPSAGIILNVVTSGNRAQNEKRNNRLSSK